MNWRSALVSLALVCAVGLLAACATTPADLVLRNGKVVTVDEAFPEAEAIAVTGDRVVAVGSDREIGKYVGESTEVIDLEGRLAIITSSCRFRRGAPVQKSNSANGSCSKPSCSTGSTTDLGHARIHVGVLVGFTRNGSFQVCGSTTERHTGSRITTGFQVFQVTVGVAGFTFCG